MALPVGFYGLLQWIGWLSLLDEVALNHWNTHKRVAQEMNGSKNELYDAYHKHI